MKAEKHFQLPISLQKNPYLLRVSAGNGKKSAANSAKNKFLLDEFKKLKCKTMFTNYQPAKLYKGPKHWYVYYYYRHPNTQQFQRFKEYFDINRIKNLRDRDIYGREMVSFLNKKLANGLNPFTMSIQAGIQKQVIPQLTLISQKLSVNKSLEAKRDYQTFVNRLARFIKQATDPEITLPYFNDDLANSFKDFMIQENLSKKSINSTLSHLAMFWDEAIREKLAIINPMRTVQKVKRETRKMEDEQDVYEPLTFDELSLIFAYLKKTKENGFLRYLAIIYMAWARPVEICRLRVADIVISNDQDYIKFKAGNTKNNQGNFVQIVPPLKNLLQEIDLKKYPPNYYLFSDGFLPGPVALSRKYITIKWNKIVIRGLCVNKRMYALKHTGNIEYLLKNKGNIDLKWQQTQNRHKSSMMTDRYNRRLGAYFIDMKDLVFGEI